MFGRVLILAVGGVLVSGCIDRPSETQEVTEDLIQAGGATNGIGHDVEMPQEASRRMLEVDETTAGGVAALGDPDPEPNSWVSELISGSQSSFQIWSLYVPAGKSQVTFTISGGTGDADLYLSFGSPPTTTSYGCRPYLSGNNETCTFKTPQAGTYYVGVLGYAAYSGVSLTGAYDDPPEICPPWPWPWPWRWNPIPPLPPPPWWFSVADSTVGHFRYWTLDVPSGQSSVTFTTSGGTGDADLYVNFGAAPSATTYQCRPYLNGNNETCKVTSPSAGTFYVGLRTYSAYSGVTLTTTYTAGQ